MTTTRREFLTKTTEYILLTGAATAAWEYVLAGKAEASPNYKTTEHWWAMIIDIEKCIGCGNCVRACSEENGVPKAISAPGSNATTSLTIGMLRRRTPKSIRPTAPSTVLRM